MVPPVDREEVNAARGEPVWFQLYPRNDWNQTRQMIRRAETSGCPALVFGPPTWEFVKRLKDASSMKLVVKGIVTREDAAIAMEHGVVNRR